MTSIYSIFFTKHRLFLSVYAWNLCVCLRLFGFNNKRSLFVIQSQSYESFGNRFVKSPSCQSNWNEFNFCVRFGNWYRSDMQLRCICGKTFNLAHNPHSRILHLKCYFTRINWVVLFWHSVQCLRLYDWKLVVTLNRYAYKQNKQAHTHTRHLSSNKNWL